MSETTRQAGVLLHITSLPSRFGIGDMGAGARRFVDWLAAANVRVWQILPLVPPGPGQSPYATGAALAGNPQFIDLDALVEAGLLEPGELEEDDGSSLDWVQFDTVVPRKQRALLTAARRLAEGAGPLAGPFAEFTAATTSDWAREAALFFVLKARHGDRAWWEWDDGYKRRQRAPMAAFEMAHREEIQDQLALLFLFEHQWAALRRYAQEHGVSIFGDLPIYVALDSVDVWSDTSQFALDETLRPREVGGVPPDYFSETGQLWGNPLYDWAAMAADKHRWWTRRLARALELYDLVRIDHFRAFAGYWAIPADAPDARSGQWRPGPGRRLFDDVQANLAQGPLPLVAEDLGMLDESVHALRRDLGLPGMVILHFAFGGEPDHAYLPHMHQPDQIAYTGTHDNDTTRGFWESAPDDIKHKLRTYLSVDGGDVVWDLIRATMGSQAGMAVIPMQDLLELDGGARFNTPGLADGNWRWRARPEAFNDALAQRLGDLVEATGRD